MAPSATHPPHPFNLLRNLQDAQAKSASTSGGAAIDDGVDENARLLEHRLSLAFANMPVFGADARANKRAMVRFQMGISYELVSFLLFFKTLFELMRIFRRYICMKLDQGLPTMAN